MSCLTADALLCKLMDAILGLLRDDRTVECRYHILHNVRYAFIEDVRLQDGLKLAFCALGRHLDRLDPTQKERLLAVGFLFNQGF